MSILQRYEVPFFDADAAISNTALGRKLKCDGRQTCANCERRGITCTYVPVYALLYASYRPG